MAPARAGILGVGMTVFALAGLVVAPPAGAWHPDPTVLRVQETARQDVAPEPGSEPDTLVEPDVAVSPVNPNIAVAVAHDGRYPDGGAVAISYSWTHDGGRTWHHAPLPGITKATGGVWDRVSDPVAAFGPDGTAYISTLPISLSCPSGVAVSRSTDGGRTFGPPVLAHLSTDCAYSDDKNWLVVDTNRYSPHRGRLYQFWTPFLADAQGNLTGSPQVVRWSDDRGEHWSPTVNVSATDIFTQNSQPMIQADGTITDTYLNFGAARGDEGPERPGVGGAQSGSQRGTRLGARQVGDRLVARTSRDGGLTWSAEVLVTDDVGEGPAGIRCCLPSATIDPVSGRMYAAWNSVTPDQVRLARSVDGRHWSRPVTVSRSGQPGLDRVNVDVSAYGGRVFVSYGTRDTTVEAGRYVQQQVSASYDRGAHFGAPVSVGPLSDLRYAAQARGIFPGDYIGSAATRGRVYLVWCLSSTPPDPAALFHQTLWSAVLAP
ncbi:MAG TPA: sialidase family protein [Mycobacteriales bacterium]|nr:sialidase family protein [Mycobacteriales bacterium]